MELIQVRGKAQLTLPLSVRRKLGIEEGDIFDVQVRDGEIILKAKKLVDKEQAWFWTKRWQEGEIQADEDIKSGHVYHFPDTESGIAFLHERTRKKKVNAKAKT